jgi:hypothetical protein
MRLWRSTLYASLCFFLYVAIGVSYRYANTDAKTHVHVNVRSKVLMNATSPILGCNRGSKTGLGRFRQFAEFFDDQKPARGPETILTRGGQGGVGYFCDAAWCIDFGWHSFSDPRIGDSDLDTPRVYGTIQGPALLATSMRLDLSLPEADGFRQDRLDLRVATHPTCGPLLLSCIERATATVNVSCS